MIQIHLRDYNSNIAIALGYVFAHTEVEVSCGNIFDVKADTLISPANSYGWMDGGIDLVYCQHIGFHLQALVQDEIREQHNGKLPVGKAVLVYTEHDVYRYMIAAPTMEIPGPVPNSQNAYLAFKAALKLAVDYNRVAQKDLQIKSIVSPGLGTLTGRIPPQAAARQMRQAYDEVIGCM